LANAEQTEITYSKTHRPFIINITYDVPRLATTIQGERIIKLIPMCEAEFETFMEISMRNQSQDQVKAGKWKAEEADTNI